MVGRFCANPGLLCTLLNANSGIGAWIVFRVRKDSSEFDRLISGLLAAKAGVELGLYLGEGGVS
jgi:hypothetical protein